MTRHAPDQDGDAEGGPLAGFTLLGGPFHAGAVALAARLGLGGALAAGIGISLALWAILAALALAEGHAGRFFSQEAMAIHARLLLAVPLIFLCEGLFDRAARDACGAIARSRMLEAAGRRAVDATALRLVALNRSWWLQGALLVVVLVFTVTVPPAYLPGTSGALVERPATGASLTGLWYWVVCLPFFRFVMARFLWLLCLWTILIWAVAKQGPKLDAAHPDRAGGLGLLEVAQTQLLVFVLALAVIDAAALAETFRLVPPDEPLIYLHVALVALMGVIALCGPISTLVAPLYRARRIGLIQFGDLGRTYATRFGERWIGTARKDEADLLGSPDIQSLADLANGYENVRRMRILPMSSAVLIGIVVCAAIPHVPLLLLKYPMTDLLFDLVNGMIGR